MTDDYDDDVTEPRSRRFTLARYVFKNPRNLFTTIACVLVLGTMVSNGYQRDSKSKIHSHTSQPKSETPELEKEKLPPVAENTADTPTPSTPEKDNPQKPEVPSEIPAATQVQSAISEAALSEISQTHDQLTTLEQKIAEQEKTIAALSEQLQDIAALRDKIDVIENRSSEKLASITLFGQVREAAIHGDAFKPLLDQLLELNKTNPQANALLMQLLPVAATGTHSTEELKNQFADALAATLQHDTTNSFSGNLRKLIRIRKIGAEQTGMDTESILARAEASVTAQDFRSALKTLSALNAEDKKTMATWMRNAQESLDTQSTIIALQLALSGKEPNIAQSDMPLPKADNIEKDTATKLPGTPLETGDLNPDEIATPETTQPAVSPVKGKKTQ